MKKVFINLLFVMLSLSIIPSMAIGELTQADLFNVSFNESGYTDAAGKATITVSEDLVTVYDESMKMYVANFSGVGDAEGFMNDFIIGHFGSDEFAKYVNTFTLESYFKLDKLPSTGSVCPISGQQAGGLGFEVNSTGKLSFFCRSGSAYNQPNKDAVVETGKYYHAVGVFDGSTVSLYLNGELIASEAANGATIAWPAGDEHNALVIGGDIGVGGKADHGMTGSVALAKAYSTAFTKEQVAAEYEKVKSMSEVNTEPPETTTENPATYDPSVLFVLVMLITFSISYIYAKREIYL